MAILISEFPTWFSGREKKKKKKRVQICLRPYRIVIQFWFSAAKAGFKHALPKIYQEANLNIQKHKPRIEWQVRIERM